MGKFHILFRGAWELFLSIAGAYLLTLFPKGTSSEWPLLLLCILLIVAMVGSAILALSDFGLAWRLHRGEKK